MLTINSIQSNYFGNFSTRKMQLLSSDNNKTKASLTHDVFVKSSSDISFTGFKKAGKKDNLAEALKAKGMKGAPFLLGLAASVGMSKFGKGASNIIFDRNGFTIKEDGISSEMVNIDTDDGIIKIEGTGIDIDADNYDYVDWDNLVFKNYDGSVDIDLLNNRYIDTENGIFVDPNYGISAVLDGDHFENIAIPSFGSGHGCHPWDPVYTQDIGEQVRRAKLANGGSTADEDGFFKRAAQSLKDLFNLSPSAIEDRDYKDIFGNDIIQIQDYNGDSYLTSVPYSGNSLFARVSEAIQDDGKAAELVNDVKLSLYMGKNYPSFGTKFTVYEGGADSDIHFNQQYDSRQVNDVLDKISHDGGYYPDPGSREAINFIKYQNTMLKSGIWDKPMIAPMLMLDMNGDGIPDVDIDGDGIPDYDVDGDGIVDFSSDLKGGLLQSILNGIKSLFD